MKILLTIDIETIKEIQKIIKILKKVKIRKIFFVPAKLLESNPSLFRRLSNFGEIGLHGYEHERFDLLSYAEKEKLIRDSIKIYKKVLRKKPRYFRTPQFSVDFDLLEILEKYGFKKDFSVTEFPIFQTIFFPSFFLTYLKQTKIDKKIKERDMKIKEVKLSSFIFPFSLFFLKILPFPIFLMTAKLYTVFRKPLVFLAHSYEFNNENLIKKFLKFIDKIQ